LWECDAAGGSGEKNGDAGWSGFGYLCPGSICDLSFVDQRSRLQKRLAGKEKAVAEMQLLRQQYQRINQQSGAMASLLDQREEGFSLFAFLEENAAESAVKERIVSMKPSESQEGEMQAQSRVK
jgi:general secretion pathway protein M